MIDTAVNNLLVSIRRASSSLAVAHRLRAVFLS